MRARILIALLAAAAAVMLSAAPALAFNEIADGPDRYLLCSCHPTPIPQAEVGADPDCQHCHGYTTDFPVTAPDSLLGPHGMYSTTTNKCDSCHTIHDAPAARLLPAATVKDTCFSCHDGTGGYGVYGAVKAQTGQDPATDTTLGSHRVEATSVVPGGDAATGGSAADAFSGPAGVLSCLDCHSVHGTDLVQPFTGERRRIRAPGFAVRWDGDGNFVTDLIQTSKLLRRQPTGAATPTNEYGSDWCAGCHAGRVSGGAVHNHPVETAATWPVEATRFVYRRVAGGRTLGGSLRLYGLHPWGQEVLPADQQRDFLMADPRTIEQGAHLPICQQCHEDSRDVTDLNADGTANWLVGAETRGADGIDPDADPGDHIEFDNNPRFQNFPHETQNNNFLIETGDDLCLNCHRAAGLP